MSTLGKLTNSFLNATNENTLALANLNFDFAILKYEAPKEFQVVGTNLSMRRRNEAEDGKTHRIAGRLGALFESIVPATPNLINAYGSRASEIAASPRANPKQSSKYGPFAEFVGIDGTSLWAAATSAKSNVRAHAPLAMYLLACMLARRWDPTVAVSIWVEIVEQRQKEIEASFQEEAQHISLFMAAKHEITRDDLAQWDASARAWLQSADEAKSLERTKFDLIAKNISIDIGRDRRTYHNVVEVWTCAMQGMELLVQGVPQELSDGAILLALSAWHLYPDLIVLGKTTKKASFQDPLISSGGTITVGLQYDHDLREPGMHWSLTLSQLSYYDGDTKVHARTDTSRVSMKELLIVAFGGFMSSWNVPPQSESDAAELLIELRHRTLEGGSYDPAWLRIVALASQEVLDLKYTDKTLCTELIAWGRRRAKNWLLNEKSLRFFGLLDPCVSTALTATDGHEAAFLYFRKRTEALDSGTRTFVIRYREERVDTSYFEFATVAPHVRRSGKRGLDGSLRSEEHHQRWLHLATHERFSSPRCFCTQCDASCPCRQSAGSYCGHLCHPAGSSECQGLVEIDKSRIAVLAALGEQSQWVSRRDVYASGDPRTFFWQNAPAMLRGDDSTPGVAPQTCPSLKNGFERCSCAEPLFPQVAHGIDELVFQHVEGNPETYCLFATSKKTHVGPDGPRVQGGPKTTSDKVTTPDLQRAISSLKGGSVNKDVLQRYLRAYESSLSTADPADLKAFFISRIRTTAGLLMLLKPEDIMSSAQRVALSALDTAQKVYEYLPGAFIPLSITANPLSSVAWLRDDEKTMRRIQANIPPVNDGKPALVDPLQSSPDQDSTQNLIARHFACIVYFESGMYNLQTSDCRSVIAVASGNSIFVAGYLTSDPQGDVISKGLIRRLPGNVGMAGISLLIPPQQPPHIRPLSNNFRMVPHVEFDGKQEDNFSPTSLHLRFTKWRRPYNAVSRGTIDEGLFYVESVVSVRDSGEWVCDLDVQSASTNALRCLWKPICVCGGQGDATHAISVDTWEELLDPPDGLGIVRVKNNWPARFATFALRCQKGFESRTLLIPVEAQICSRCVAAEYSKFVGDDCGILID